MANTKTPVSIDSGGHKIVVFARRDELVAQHLSLAEGIARAIKRTLPPSFDLDDLIGTANVALLHAATRYRPEDHGDAPFASYARTIIAGAVYESVRRKRWTAQTHPGLEQVGAYLRPDPRNPDLVEEIDRGRRHRRLVRAVASLPKDQKTDVVLAYYSPEEPTFRKVAEISRHSLDRGREIHTNAICNLRERLKAA